MKKVLCALSGGVDSSVAALLLKKNYTVEGVTLKLFDKVEFGFDNSADITAAAELCGSLNIKHHVLSVQSLFKEKVICPFTEAYFSGLTPNPCIICNKHIKFGAMLDFAMDSGFDYLATGHYANIINNGSHFSLCKPKDGKKDQTYFLYNLTQRQLKKILLPLGELTKDEVRNIAHENGFVCADRSDSQDICFIKDKYFDFLEKQKKAAPGDFLDISGNVLARHKGIIRYTIGQRKGLGPAFGKPKFVISKNAEKNTVTLGEEQNLYTKKVYVGNVNLIEELPARVTAKLRYNSKEQPAFVEKIEGNACLLEFDEPVKAVTPGQAAVFYDGEIILGGGIISGQNINN